MSPGDTTFRKVTLALFTDSERLSCKNGFFQNAPDNIFPFRCGPFRVHKWNESIVAEPGRQGSVDLPLMHLFLNSNNNIQNNNIQNKTDYSNV